MPCNALNTPVFSIALGKEIFTLSPCLSFSLFIVSSEINPFSFSSPDIYLNKINTICEVERSFRYKFPERYVFPIYPERGGLFPWAETKNGDVLFWITQHKPDDWPTLVKEPETPEFEVVFSPCHQLLYQYLQH